MGKEQRSLREIADSALVQRNRRRVKRALAQLYAAAVRLFDAGDTRQNGALPGTRCSEERHAFAGCEPNARFDREIAAPFQDMCVKHRTRVKHRLLRAVVRRFAAATPAGTVSRSK